MCARFTLTPTKEQLEERFRAELGGFPYRPRYNISPDEILPVIASGDPTSFVPMTWGLRPIWWKTASRALVNIRKETLAEKKTFARLFEKNRCLVPADGFYEWKEEGRGKQPYRIVLKNDELFAFPGIWEEETDENGQIHRAVSIITTVPNALVKKIHDRMPCILEPQTERVWLDPKANRDDLLKLLFSFPPSQMRAYAVDRNVNNPRLNDPKLILPLSFLTDTKQRR